jgi:hypothetical protein
VPRIVGQRLRRTYESLLASPEREWSLTDAQKERLGEHLETEYATLISLLGENFHSAVIRMAVQIERIAMILTAMRGDSALSRGAGNELRPASNAGIIDKGIRLQDDTMDERDDKDRPYMVDTIYCSDQDYEAAEMIGNKLLIHMASAYRMIDGDAQVVVPEIKPIDQRKVLFEALPEEYASKQLEAEARLQGVSRATSMRWNEEWQTNGMVQKVRYGVYRKIA